MNPSSFQGHTVWSKRVENATIFLLSSHPSFYRSWNLSLVTSWNTVPEERKSLRHFHMSVFLGVSLNCFWCTWTCYECSKCLYHRDTKFELCFMYFCIMGLNFHLSKKWYELFSCNVFVCKPDISNTSKSEPVYALLAIIPSQYTQQRIWKKLAHCRVLFIGQNVHLHTLDVQPSVLNCESSSQTATSDGFQLIFSCPLPVVA